MSRRSKLLVSRNLYHLGVATLATSVVWTGVGVLHALWSPGKINVKPEVLAPLSAKIDQKTIEKLRTREKISDQEIEILLKTPTPELVPEEQASGAAELALP